MHINAVQQLTVTQQVRYATAVQVSLNICMHKHTTNTAVLLRHRVYAYNPSEHIFNL